MFDTISIMMPELLKSLIPYSFKGQMRDLSYSGIMMDISHDLFRHKSGTKTSICALKSNKGL